MSEPRLFPAQVFLPGRFMLYRGYVILPPLFVTIICISDQLDL